MDDEGRFGSLTDVAARRRMSWRRDRTHRAGTPRDQEEDASARFSPDMMSVCLFFDWMGVPNSATAHRNFIRAVWHMVEERLGRAPDPARLVIWRDLARAIGASRRSGGAE